MNGFLNVLKPPGMSSAAVVSFVKRMAKEPHVGHAGTLDPEAAGVLPIMIGRATRLFDYLVDKEKSYVAECAFGASTDTQDAQGRVLGTGEAFPDMEAVRQACLQLTGDIVQRPSMYSAIKVGGKPLYLRARRGETVEVPARTVRIDKIQLIQETPDHGFEIRVCCGRGTYIRTLCADLGRLCGCPAHMRSLTRTRSGVFGIADALTIEEAKMLAEKGKLAEKLQPPDYVLGHLQRTDIPVKYAKMVENGAKLPVLPGMEKIAEGDPVRIYLRGRFWGIAARQGQMLVWKALIAPEDISEEMR